ncbi:MAG: hypothetical protein V2A76_08860 [Planctomycetota bacterium]
MVIARTVLICVLCLTAVSLPGCIGVGLGKAGADLELETPQLGLVLSLDRQAYGVGAPIIAKLTLVNKGELPVSVARPSPLTVDFYLRPHTSPEPLHTQMVSWPDEVVDFVPIEPGESHQRSHILSRATLKEGSYDLLAVYRSEPEAELKNTATVASNAVPITVSLPVEMERDSLGLIVEAEASRIAKTHFGREDSRIDARLVMDSRMKMHQWWVTVYYAAPTAEGEAYGSCFVDPYLGVIKGITKEQVKLDTTPRWVIENPDGTTESGR